MNVLKKLLSSTSRFVFILVAFAALAALNWTMWSKDRAQERQIVALHNELAIQQQENQKMRKNNADLRRRIDSLKRGSIEMVEEEARDNFGMVGDGETFFDFQSPSDKTNTQ